MFEHLTSMDEVRDWVQGAYRQAGPAGQHNWRWGDVTHTGPLSLDVAEPGPLMTHAVKLAGDDGITLQDLRKVFDSLGKERFDRGVATMRSSGDVTQTSERRPNKAGRPQAQAVFRYRERA